LTAVPTPVKGERQPSNEEEAFPIKHIYLTNGSLMCRKARKAKVSTGYQNRFFGKLPQT
jgi:hypothetical protein